MTNARRGTPTVTIRLSPEQINRLKKLAEERSMTVSLLIREAIRLYLLVDANLDA